MQELLLDITCAAGTFNLRAWQDLLPHVGQYTELTSPVCPPPPPPTPTCFPPLPAECLLLCLLWSVLIVLTCTFLIGSLGCRLGDHRSFLLAVALNKPPGSVASGAGLANSPQSHLVDKAQGSCGSPMMTELPPAAGKAQACWSQH